MDASDPPLRAYGRTKPREEGTGGRIYDGAAARPECNRPRDRAVIGGEESMLSC